MYFSARLSVTERFEELLNSPKHRARRNQIVTPVKNEKANGSPESLLYLEKVILFAGSKLRPSQLILICLLFSAIFGFLSSLIVPLWASAIVAAAGAYFPLGSLDRKAQSRAQEFAADFPTVLLATASSLSAGHTALISIERSVRLIPKTNPVRREISMLLDALRTGVSKEDAIKNFAPDIRLPELELFRSAFLLSLDSGGRFSPTLQRLAQVLKDRSILILSARTATAVMRMTSTVLILFTPLIVGMVAVRTPNFIELFTTHPVASQVGSGGLLLIAFNCWILRQMSDFRP